MDNNILKIIFRVVAVLLSLGALVFFFKLLLIYNLAISLELFFQLINFVFGTMVKNVSDMQDDYWYYGTELIPHLFTIIIIIWFVVFQIRKIINMK